MSNNGRRLWLAACLAGTVAATGWVASQDQVDSAPAAGKSVVAAPREQREAGKSAPAPIADLPLEKLKREPVQAPVGNLFPGRSWEPPPVVVKPAPPPPPVAPPLPFTLFGQMTENAVITAFLDGRDRSYAVKVGDVLNKTYRVDAIRDNTVVFTYLPLNQQQTLQAGVN